MNERVCWPAIAACFVVVGCAAPGGPSTKDISSDCAGAFCEIDVFAECDGNACAASADKKILRVRDRGAIVIQWKLRTGQDFRFADGGVRFGSGAPFECNPVQADRITCVDHNQGAGTYEYKLDVVRSGSPPTTIPVDPWVVNK
jgi:hypothetical protein